VTTDAFDFYDSDDLVRPEREVAFLPSADTVYTMWYKGHWMRVERYRKESSYGRHRCYVQLWFAVISANCLFIVIINRVQQHTFPFT